MRRYLVLLLTILLAMTLYGQKSGIVSNKIKIMIVYENKIEKNKTITKKESESRYDTKGNVVEEIEYKDGKVNKRTTFTYDDEGKKIKEVEFDAFDKVVKATDYKYKGDLKIEKIISDAKGNIKSKKTYQYETY